MGGREIEEGRYWRREGGGERELDWSVRISDDRGSKIYKGLGRPRAHLAIRSYSVYLSRFIAARASLPAGLQLGAVGETLPRALEFQDPAHGLLPRRNKRSRGFFPPSTSSASGRSFRKLREATGSVDAAPGGILDSRTEKNLRF